MTHSFANNRVTHSFADDVVTHSFANAILTHFFANDVVAHSFANDVVAHIFSTEVVDKNFANYVVTHSFAHDGVTHSFLQMLFSLSQFCKRCGDSRLEAHQASYRFTVALYFCVTSFVVDGPHLRKNLDLQLSSLFRNLMCFFK